MSQDKPQGPYLQVFPVQGNDRCVPGGHDGWAINMIDPKSHATYAGTVHDDRQPAKVIKELFDAFPNLNGQIQVQWQSPQGNHEETAVAGPMNVMDELMITVCDETPDDAENTDEHPLEEMRSILMDVDELMNDAPEPS